MIATTLDFRKPHGFVQHPLKNECMCGKNKWDSIHLSSGVQIYTQEDVEEIVKAELTRFAQEVGRELIGEDDSEVTEWPDGDRTPNTQGILNNQLRDDQREKLATLLKKWKGESDA